MQANTWIAHANMEVNGNIIHVPVYITAERIRAKEEVLVHYGEEKHFVRDYKVGRQPDIQTMADDETISTQFEKLCELNGLNVIQVRAPSSK